MFSWLPITWRCFGKPIDMVELNTRIEDTEKLISPKASETEDKFIKTRTCFIIMNTP